MAKIIIINLPDRGHVNPTIALTKEMALRGHKITYLITEEFREIITATGASVICYEDGNLQKNHFLSMIRCTGAALTVRL